LLETIRIFATSVHQLNQFHVIAHRLN